MKTNLERARSSRPVEEVLGAEPRGGLEHVGARGSGARQAGLSIGVSFLRKPLKF